MARRSSPDGPHGVVLIDKPVGPTSHDVVSRVRKALNTRRVGHGGTLDPFATGLLVVLVGSATRLARFVSGHEKSYVLDLQFGAWSTTDDRMGDLHQVSEATPSVEDISQALAQLRTHTEQRPPAVSAIHVDGERAWKRVLRGEELELPMRVMYWRSLELVDYNPHSRTARIAATCSAGTYLRSLARDLGELVGTGAYATELRRTAIGQLTVSSACDLEDVGVGALLPALTVLEGRPQHQLSPQQVVDARHGKAVHVPLDASALEVPWHVLVSAEGDLVGMAEVVQGALRPRVIMPPPVHEAVSHT